MPGRGDNIKQRSEERNRNKQGNRPFIPGRKEHKSNRSKIHTGGRASVKTERSYDWNDERSHRRTAGNERPYRVNERQVNMLVDAVPYLVNISPFTFNDEQRFYVSINGGPEHVFTWDSEIGALRAIDDDASILPDAVEAEVSRQLQLKPR
jgi:hypothetical protein